MMTTNFEKIIYLPQVNPTFKTRFWTWTLKLTKFKKPYKNPPGMAGSHQKIHHWRFKAVLSDKAC